MSEKELIQQRGGNITERLLGRSQPERIKKLNMVIWGRSQLTIQSGEYYITSICC